MELLDHLIELGIAETVLSMQGYFKTKTIADFVLLSEEKLLQLPFLFYFLSFVSKRFYRVQL
ncbi:MAG: hypothetical protein V3T58_01350 [Candidatus Hydrothermarchaeales archaeon]